ncbi:hypothetical protein PIB30_065969 [Stylosanthes scabra]|uniref:Uncharacterized protein n=1 Tax=Stylosanthes scabra TaxID=79078 RepID=A0ABU6VME6_9FABA|nr:hypothetical protein [Stylosanthes scabra]
MLPIAIRTRNLLNSLQRVPKVMSWSEFRVNWSKGTSSTPKGLRNNCSNMFNWVPTSRISSKIHLLVSLERNWGEWVKEKLSLLEALKGFEERAKSLESVVARLKEEAGEAKDLDHAERCNDQLGPIHATYAFSVASCSISQPVPIFQNQSELEEHEKTTSKLAPTKARISKRNKSSAEPHKPTLERTFADQEQ